jgi:glucosamine kinase
LVGILVSIPNAASALFVGIDGGGSTTRVLIASGDGTVCALGTADGCNPQELGATRARERLRDGFAASWAAAKISPRPLAGAFFGIAGLAAFRAQAAAETLGEGLPWSPRAVVEWDHDLRIALAGGLSGRPGLVLIAGTGSACFGRNEKEEWARAGGWGPLLDDIGGGYWLGLEALRQVCRAFDGRGPTTRLSELFKEQRGLDSPAAILSWVKSHSEARPEIAQLAPLLLTAAEAGDETAAQIVETGAAELGKLVQAVAEKIFQGAACEVVLTGGLSQHSGYFTRIADYLAAFPGRKLVRPKHPPVVGALLLALQRAEVVPGDLLWERLRTLSSSLK